ncbi:TetR/AcrR family transcriptional regulator [Nocardioides sp. Root151]|uniref:TetR/AcrR family transcriptional regulator n=1 Tax=Nocardioides sp. Root151 TaxID=1736475 RepID=UPI0007035163|nr:TetR/AcrR family transcriptional regulator [Nocardioides sp. Root151]KQZ68642.1 hypothetical protein ASD66_15255 [Nocardioides sp. Root151]
MTTESHSPGRPRRADTDDLIVATTQELIREHGPSAVNVAAVSARSGIARTTIYRRYRDRQELLGAALQPITARGGPPPGDAVHEKIEWVLARAEEVLDRGIGPGGVASVLADSDPDFSAALRDSLRTGLQPILAQVEGDIASGVLVEGLDADLLLDLVVGSYLAARLRRGSADAQWRVRISELLAGSLSGPNSDRT